MSRSSPPSLSGGVDHIHLYAPSREEVAAWYHDVFGFTPVADFAFWAEDPGGPLTIEDAGGRIHLALFSRDEAKPASFAFGATAQEYLAWRGYFAEKGLTARESDHDKSFSMYVVDPFDNVIEITCYDHATVRAAS